MQAASTQTPTAWTTPSKIPTSADLETKNETFVWCGPRICQKRSGSTVVRNYFEQGFEEGTTDYFYSRDRLGSVREVVGSDGTTIASRLSYGPWGAVTESGSGAVSDFGFTGHYLDRPSGLNLTWFRAYDPNLGRWLSTDPIGLRGGLNLYGYVSNDPILRVDPLGLEDKCKVSPGNPECDECTQKCVDAAQLDYDVCVIRFNDAFTCEIFFEGTYRACMNRGCAITCSR